MKGLRASVGVVPSIFATQPSVSPESASKFSMSVRVVGMKCGARFVLSNLDGEVTFQPEGQYQAQRRFNQSVSPTTVLDFLSGTISISPGAPV